MAKTVKIEETKSCRKDEVKALLKSKLPQVFEREPSPAFVEVNLDKLVDEITKLCS